MNSSSSVQYVDRNDASPTSAEKLVAVAGIIISFGIAVSMLYMTIFFEIDANNFSPKVDVVAASVSSGSNDSTIPAQWAVALSLDSQDRKGYQVDRVEASVLVDDSVAIATTDRFTSEPDDLDDHVRSLEIQMRTKDGELGRRREDGQAHGLEDFGVLVFAWVHTKRSFFGRFTCRGAFSLGNSSAVGSVVSAGRRSKCDVEVIRQSKMDGSWTRVSMTRHH